MVNHGNLTQGENQLATHIWFKHTGIWNQCS